MRPLRMVSIAWLSALGVTPADDRILPASVSLSITSASSMRSTVTNESPAFCAADFGGVEDARQFAAQIKLRAVAD